MKRILFILLLTIPALSLSQKRVYECNCEENQFRQTWEIDIENETIRRLSSLNLMDGMVYEGDGYRNNVIWKDNFIYFLYRGIDDGEDWMENLTDDVYFYRFDLVNNLFISEIYDDYDGSLFKHVYKCFWYK